VFGRLDQPTQFGTLADYTVASARALAGGARRCQRPRCCLRRHRGADGVSIHRAVREEGEWDRVFINGGSGGTGIWGIQIAKGLGCYVVTSCSGKNVDLCKSLGADE